jgi:hypothetical protein
MYLYSLGVYGNIIDVALPMDDNVSLLCMSCHGLKLVSCLKVIFFLGKSHLKHVLCLQGGIILQGVAFVTFKNNTDARITQLCMNNVGFSAMLE